MFFKPILLPLLAQVLLTVLVWIYLYVTRFSEMNRKDISPQQLENHSKGQELLTESTGPAENFRNLFEMPVLFFLAILLSLQLFIQDELLVQLAWWFVALRAAHSFIHCTYNRVMHRFAVYMASCFVLILMWLRLTIYILTQ